MCIGKIRNSLTFAEFLWILGISGLTNPRSPIRGIFQALAIDGKQSSDFRKKILCTICRHRSEQWFIISNGWYIRLTGCCVAQIWHSCLPIVSSYAICRPQPSSQSPSEICVISFVFPSLLPMDLGGHHLPSSILARRAWPRKSLRDQSTEPFSLK